MANLEEIQITTKDGRSHHEVVVELLRADPEFAKAYFTAALEETEQPGGHRAMLTALRHIAEAQGMANVAEKTGILVVPAKAALSSPSKMRPQRAVRTVTASFYF